MEIMERFKTGTDTAERLVAEHDQVARKADADYADVEQACIVKQSEKDVDRKSISTEPDSDIADTLATARRGQINRRRQESARLKPRFAALIEVQARQALADLRRCVESLDALRASERAEAHCGIGRTVSVMLSDLPTTLMAEEFQARLIKAGVSV